MDEMAAVIGDVVVAVAGELAEGEQLVPPLVTAEEAVEEVVDWSKAEDVEEGGGEEDDEDEDVYLWDISSSFTSRLTFDSHPGAKSRRSEIVT